MDVLLWAIIIILFLTSLVGVIIPFIPDTILLWGGFLLYQFTLAEQGLPSGFWWGMAIITLFIIGADMLANLVFVKKYGGSRWSMLGAILGLLILPFVMGPVGILIGPFLVVFLIEWIKEKENAHAFKVAWGTLVALFSSSIIKIALQLIMIGWFFWAI
ncbi:MAG: DUF456 family protein [Bacillaceae bacterium]|nr:DUF456 family protein [Bacillaceae bacterium]